MFTFYKLIDQAKYTLYITGFGIILFGFLLGCKETITILAPPSISVTSVTKLSLSSFEITIDFKPGEGQEIIDAKIELDNLTIHDAPIVIEKLAIGDSEAIIIKHVVETGKINHDYLVRAIIMTEKYRYESNSITYRSPKNNFFFRTLPEPANDYLILEPEIQINKGGRFIIEIDHLNPYEGDLKVTLDKTFICVKNFDPAMNWSVGNRLNSGGLVTIPDDIQPGDYTVYVNVENLEYKLEKKIRVLDGNWEIFNEKYPGAGMGDYAWFTIDDQLYIVGGEYASSTILNSPVWKLDIKSGGWYQKNDFPWLPESYPYFKKIYHYDLNWRNTGYILLQSDVGETELWKYIHTADSWEKVTDYPGVGFELLVGFIIGDELFVGGGVKLELNNDHSVYDFWSFNMQSGEWKRLRDLPVRQLGLWQVSATCSNNEKGYVLQFPDKLWEYEPLNDSWTVKNKFPGPFRHSTKLVAFNDDIYLIGGMYYYLGNTSYKDLWKYSTIYNDWQLKAFRPGYPNYGIAFSYDNSIITGLGYANHAYTHYNEPIIYKYTP